MCNCKWKLSEHLALGHIIAVEILLGECGSINSADCMPALLRFNELGFVGHTITPDNLHVSLLGLL